MDPAEFSRIIIKRGKQGEVVRLSEVGAVDLGAKNLCCDEQSRRKAGSHSGDLSASWQQCPLDRRSGRKTMETLKLSFPPGVDYKVVYDTTVFVRESIRAVEHTLIEAIVLVANRGDALSADLAGDDYPTHRSSCISHRHVCRHGGFRVFS